MWTTLTFICVHHIVQDLYLTVISFISLLFKNCFNVRLYSHRGERKIDISNYFNHNLIIILNLPYMPIMNSKYYTFLKANY